MKYKIVILLAFISYWEVSTAQSLTSRQDVQSIIDIIYKVNDHWQSTHPVHGDAFWNRAAYHTGNMEAYFLTKEPKFLAYSEQWAEHNEWKGAKSTDKTQWKYSYGENNDYVLFGDYQACFQTYADLYTLKPDTQKIARIREVMEHQMQLPQRDFWWWADGLYMVMPVMTKMYKITENELYLEKLYEYLQYTDSLMYDEEAGLYYRDHNFVYPKHKSVHGKKDFWARGDGWVLAAFAKVLKDLPSDNIHRDFYMNRFRTMAKAVADCQQPEGYWTRSLIDPEHAPGPETSGTAFFTYGLLWGINNGILSEKEYKEVVEKAWKYLSTVALQADGSVGYVQPIGGSAIPGQIIDTKSASDFGTGAFLLAACEYVRYLKRTEGYVVSDQGAWCWFADPRALYYQNKERGIDATYIGYIDTQGAIKATQYNNKTGETNEVLVRSCFQPDDHNNPTFLALPDGRIMIFYSRHTDEACFYYRISQVAGDITTLGEEKIIKTGEGTTYPSPFILSNDPEHIYLCWRGVEWHPTIARLTLPDKNDNVHFDWGPRQLVRYSNAENGNPVKGSRPYAKYTSNGKDKIYFAYTTTHPDNENPNWLYFSYINIPPSGNISRITLSDVRGNRLSCVDKEVHPINKSARYASTYSGTVVDKPDTSRDWVWQVAMDSLSQPLIAMVRISPDKTSHDYYYVRWTGKKWKKIFLENGGGHFHQTPDTERCYSGGIAIDPHNPHIVYASVPVQGKSGKIYEIKKYTISTDDSFTVEPVTCNSPKNNVRPYVISGSDNKMSRLLWMNGDYYHWIVSKRWPLGYPTAIYSSMESLKYVPSLNKLSKRSFTIIASIKIKEERTDDKLLVLDIMTYGLFNQKNPKPYILIGDKMYKSTNVWGNSDMWKTDAPSTMKWPEAVQHKKVALAITYCDGVLKTYINGLQDQYISCGALQLKNLNWKPVDDSIIELQYYNRLLSQEEIKEKVNVGMH